MGKTDEQDEDYKEDKKSLPSKFSPKSVNIPKPDQRQAPTRNVHNLGENRTLAIPGNNSQDFEELDNKVKSMMEKSQNRTADGHKFADLCKVCGKEDSNTRIKITLKQTISKESSSPATSEIKHSGLEMV